jgi:hypothetical protein
LPWKKYDNRTKKYVEGTEPIPIERREMERAAQHDLIAVMRLAEQGYSYRIENA